MVRRLVRFAAVAAAVVLPTVAQAQTCTAAGGGGSCQVNVAASLTIPALATLTVPSTSLTLDGSALTNFTGTQYVPGAFGNVNVSANTAYSVTIGTLAATWGGPVGRAASTLEYSTDGGTTWAAMAASAGLLSGVATNLDFTPLQFRAVILPGATTPGNTPGTYSLTVDFTLTAP